MMLYARLKDWLKVFNLTQKIDVRLAELIQNLTQINKNHGTKGIANAMMNILKSVMEILLKKLLLLDKR